MRKLLSTAVKQSEDMHPLINRRFYAASSLGRGRIPADPKKPFAVYKVMDTIPSNVALDTAPDASEHIFNVYIHDERGSYTRIDQIISALKQTIRGLTSQTSSTGARCLEARWIGTSADSEDPTYDSAMKFITFTLVSDK